MNKLILTNTGGFPVVLDDMEFMAAGLDEAFLGILSALNIGVTNEAGLILSGCEVNGNNIDSGYVYLNGEVLFYPGDTGVLPIAGGSEGYFALKITFNPTGNKTFQDTAVHDTYAIRRAEFIVSASPPANRLTWGDDTGRTLFTVLEQLDNGLMVSDRVASSSYTTSLATLHTLIPSAIKTATLGLAIWQFTIAPPSTGGGTGITNTFTILRNAIAVQTAIQTTVNDGARHIITVIGFTSYAPGDTFTFKAIADALSTNYTNGWAGFISLSAFK